MGIRQVRCGVLESTCSISLLTLLSGCFFYTSKVSVIPDGALTCSLSESDQAAAIAVISQVAQRFKLAPNPNIESLRKLSHERDTFAYWILADYSRDGDRETERSRIILTVGVQEDMGRFTVMITDMDKGSESSFTRELEHALVTAFGARFPTHHIEITRTREGPLIPP
jgi:hypothetical protein